MKILMTLTLILIFGVSAQAQSTPFPGRGADRPRCNTDRYVGELVQQGYRYKSTTVYLIPWGDGPEYSHLRVPAKKMLGRDGKIAFAMCHGIAANLAVQHTVRGPWDYCATKRATHRGRTYCYDNVNLTGDAEMSLTIDDVIMNDGALYVQVSGQTNMNFQGKTCADSGDFNFKKACEALRFKPGLYPLYPEGFWIENTWFGVTGSQITSVSRKQDQLLFEGR